MSNIAPTVIDLTVSEDENEECDQTFLAKRGRSHPMEETRKRRREQSTSRDGTSSAKSQMDDDDEVQIVEAPRVVLELDNTDNNPKRPKTMKGEESDEIELVGIKNLTRFSHLRQYCTEEPFFQTNALRCCESCFCYVCDRKALECKTWKIHCHAVEKGADAERWKAMRNRMRGIGVVTRSAHQQASPPKPSSSSSPPRQQQRILRSRVAVPIATDRCLRQRTSR